MTATRSEGFGFSGQLCFGEAFEPRSSNTESAKAAGLILPSLPQGGFVCDIVLADKKVLHPIAFAPEWRGVPMLWRWWRLGNFRLRYTFVHLEIAIPEPHRQLAIHTSFDTHCAAA
jgi:hypothetical protein